MLTMLFCAGIEMAFTQTTDVQPQSEEEKSTNTLGMEFRLIPAGSFMMGSPSSEKDREGDEGPQHKVTITRAFYMQTTEVTQDQWYRVMKTTIGAQRDKGKPEWKLYGEGGSLPMYYVSWDEAMEFCKKLSSMDGRTYRLPTEAEWEYACRAGTSTRYYWGDDLNYNDIGHYAWYDGNSNQLVHSVGSKKPNRWGLYDMSGNVWEWCLDWYDENAYPPVVCTDPQGPPSGSGRVVRGSSWRGNALLSRSARRHYFTPSSRNDFVGFRVRAVPTEGK